MSKDNFTHDPDRRLPFIRTRDAYDELDHLSAEEKQLGKELMRYDLVDQQIGAEGGTKPFERSPDLIAAQIRNPSVLSGQWDPKLHEMGTKNYIRMLSVCIGMSHEEFRRQLDINAPPIEDPEVRRRYDTSQFMELKIMHDWDADWAVHVMAEQPNICRMLKNHQFALLGMPGSALWDDEQRLILQFTEGLMNRTVSDDLYSRAEKFWGLKQMLRYAYWISWYAGCCCMLPALLMNDADTKGRRA